MILKREKIFEIYPVKFVTLFYFCNAINVFMTVINDRSKNYNVSLNSNVYSTFIRVGDCDPSQLWIALRFGLRSEIFLDHIPVWIAIEAIFNRDKIL